MTAIYIDCSTHGADHARRIYDTIASRYDSSEGLVLGRPLTVGEKVTLKLRQALEDALVVVAVISKDDLTTGSRSHNRASAKEASNPQSNLFSVRTGHLQSAGRLLFVIVEPDQFPSQAFRDAHSLQASSLHTEQATLTLATSTYVADLEHIADTVQAKLQLAASPSDSELWASHHPELVKQFSGQTRNKNDGGVSITSDEPQGVEVRWSTDSATNTDLLKRDALAQVLNARLREAHDDDPKTSLLVHLDGTWGSGKSTVLMLLAKHLRAEPPFLLVWFDAWQQSRISPPWWALLTSLRRYVFADRNWLERQWLRGHEMAARARVSGAPYVMAIIFLLILTAGLGYTVWWLAGRFTPATGDLIRLFTPAIAMVTFLWAGSRVAARILLWESARGARLFEQANENPMARVAVHFEWLLRRSKKLVVFFVDDLDRCREEYVVEFMDSVHTLVRDAPRSHHGTLAKSHAPAAYFVVAADGAWIRQSYESAYKAFEEPIAASGGSLGYLFMNKLFQLTVPMPSLGGGTQKEFMGRLLGLAADDSSPQATAASSAIQQAAGDEKAIIQTLDGLSQEAREAVAAEAALALASADTRKHTEHTLRKFAPLLHGNPRSTKLFLNTYSMMRSVRTLEGNTVSPNTLALWSLIRVRWPSIADFLQHNPDAIEGIKDELWCTDYFPEELQVQAKSKDLRRVVLHAEGGPLTPDLIRQCCGMAEN